MNLKKTKIIVVCALLMINLLFGSFANAIDIGAGIETGGLPEGFVEKKVQNISSIDDVNRVGDILEYTITLYNDAPFSTWKNVTLTDTLPNGVDFLSEYGVFVDGVASNHSYDTSKRILLVPIGDLAGDDETLDGVVSYKDVVVVKLRASINESAYETTQINHVFAKGNNSEAAAQDSGIFVESLNQSYCSVSVKYQDEEGNELAPSEVLSGKEGLPYTCAVKNIPGWTLKTTPVNAVGTFTDQVQEVIYVYERINAAPVTVKYQDEEGNELAPSEVLSGKVGSPYITTAKEIAGWTLKTTPDNATGTFSEEAQEVVYVHERTSAAPVTVKYQDEEGNELAPSEVLSGKVGSPYITTAKEIAGWILKTTPDNATGIFSEEAQEVVYVHERANAVPVTVKYQNEEGNELAPSEVLSGKVGLPYLTTAKEIAGWALKTTPNNVSGIFTEKVQEVVYVYERLNAAPVTVKYQDEDGNELASSEVLSGKIGQKYQSKEKSIDDWSLKGTPANANGTFTDKPQEVVYIYELIKLEKKQKDNGSKDSSTRADSDEHNRISNRTNTNVGVNNQSSQASNYKILPKTGEKTLKALTIFGLFLVGIAIALYFYFKRKKIYSNFF